MENIEFNTLLGEHILDGVDFGSETDKYGDDCQLMSFRLDGDVYTAKENPADGYRSSLEYLIKSDAPIKNSFTPCRVVCKEKGRDRYGSNDTLQFIDLKTGQIVLEVGTDNDDDYYPSFVASFAPENMACNEGK